MQTISTQLARRFASLSFEDLPAATVDTIKALVLDYLGVALAGSGTESGKATRAFVAETGGNGQATVIGQAAKAPPALAAFSNAIASHSVELDDIDVLALFHFSPPVLSAALAAAEQTDADGRSFIAAAASGCEMMERLSRAANNSLRNRGFHTTPTCGVFGATVAASKLFGLDEERMVSALGLAGAQSGGLMEMYGPSMQKRFNPGPAARDGIVSARMAAHGFTGTDTILEGERGFLCAFTDRSDQSQLLAGLDGDYLLEIEFKPYSCARPIHNAIDCALEIRRAAGFDIKGIENIQVARHPDWALYHQNPSPRTYHEAQVSLPWSVAVGLTDGAALFDQYRDDLLDKPNLTRLARMVEISSDASLKRGVSCHMTVTMKNGDRLEAIVDYPRGSIQNPMSLEDRRTKFRSLSVPVIGERQAASIIDAVEMLEESKSIRSLLGLAQFKH